MTDETAHEDVSAILHALDRSHAMAEFSPDGIILTANSIFLHCLGYKLAEIKGKHHRMLVDPAYAESSEYAAFWQDLGRGEAISGEMMRLGKGGREVWFQATYSPVVDSEGVLLKVIKLATDITDLKLTSANDAGMIAGVERSMAVIEFRLDGTILSANEIFLRLLGYSRDELVGKHHRVLVSHDYASSAEYAQFWADLAAGKPRRGKFERLRKDGDSVWLEATYSPIHDPSGRLVKIVKFAYDITDSMRQAEELKQALARAEEARELEIALAKAQEAERARQEMDLAVQELSTPVTPIWKGILLLPLVGILDSTRTSDIMNKSLKMISETRAKVFVLDISGVATVDTAVANQLIKITKATQLMGCEAIVSGLSPAIARTIVELGVNVGEIRTTATLRDAFETALSLVGEWIGRRGAADPVDQADRT